MDTRRFLAFVLDIVVRGPMGGTPRGVSDSRAQLPRQRKLHEHCGRSIATLTVRKVFHQVALSDKQY